MANFYAIVGRTLKLVTFTASYFQASVVFPYIIVAPYFFLGKITLGQMTQTAGAFSRVESSLNFFIARYQSLASFKAVVERLTTFRSAIEEARVGSARSLRASNIPGIWDAIWCCATWYCVCRMGARSSVPTG